jgi:hypothetical protein
MAYTDIDKPSDYFNTSTWTATTSAISNLDFSPDWVWIKSTDSANGQILFDTIRGANERLSSSSNGAESTRTDELMSFDSNGYTLGSSGNTNDTSPFNASYVGWSWRGSDSSAVSNTDGSITSTVSANSTSGFSIVSFTGTGSALTAGHGLGVKPSMIIAKSTTIANNWIVQHGSLGATNTIFLDNTNPSQTGTSFWNDTEPTSSVFSLGNWSGINTSGSGIIAYCFADVKGYSKFGSSTGNGSTDGTFVYTGMKPSFVMYKASSISGQSWLIHDNKRGNQGANANPQDLRLLANATNTEADVNIDFLSNSFKPRAGDAHINSSGTTYIYMAFAENPFTTSTGVPATAR